MEQHPVTCRQCGRELQLRDRFCQWCGTPQPAQPPSGPPSQTGAAASGEAGSAPSGEAGSAPTVSSYLPAEERELRELRAAVNSLTGELARISLRLEVLERGDAPPAPVRQPREPAARGAPPPPASTAPAVPVTSVATPVADSDQALRNSRGDAPSGGTAAPADSIDRLGDTPPSDQAGLNWEWLLGGNWLARIGIVAIIFGVAFFISLAIDRGWLGETERVVLGLVGGVAFLAAGEYWRRRYAVWAQTVTGGGLAILYLSVYGAFALYELIAPLTAFGAFSLITIGGAVLSLRHEAVGVAVFSILGGFATPLLLQERLPDQGLLLAYVLVLDVGVLALASFRNWRWFTLLGWGGSLVLFGFWQQELEPSVALAQVGITCIFLVFVAATVAFHLIRQQPSGIHDLALLTLNAAAFYGISYLLIYDEHRPWMGGFTASVAVFYALLAAGCRWRGEPQLNLALFSAGLAVVFAVLAVPIQLGGPWISMAWGVEGLVLVWMSFPLRMRELRWAGYAMFVVSAIWLLALDTPGAFSREFTPFLNEYMISYAAAIALPALAGWLLHLRRDELEPREEAAIPIFALRSAVFAAVVVPVQLTGIWITLGWAVESVALLVLSRRLRMWELRWLGFGLMSAMLVKLLAVDTYIFDLESFLPVLNWRFLAFAAVIAALYSAGLLERRRGGEAGSPYEELENRLSFPVLLGLANLATLWLLSAEIIASANSALFDLPDRVADNVASLGLSLLWAMYAATLIVLGVARRWRWVRVAGLGLLAAPVIKLFAFDSLQLEQEYRVIAFLVLGLMLVAGGLLYQRYSRVVRGFLFE